MKNFNTVRLDSKGRLLVPYHIRELLDMDSGSEFVIMSNHEGEIKLLPLAKGKTAQMNLVMADNPQSLAKITQVMAKQNCSILMSQLRVLERGHLSEWNAILDVAQCKDVRKLTKDLESLDIIKRIEMREK